MLEKVETLYQTLHQYITTDKRYVYIVCVQQIPCHKNKTVHVQIIDRKFDVSCETCQPRSYIQYQCYNYREDSLVIHCQSLFNNFGLQKNGILNRLDYELQSKSNCPSQE